MLMAKKQITLIVDDLTGEEAGDARTITFALEGVTYEIDLTPTNAEALSEALAPYIAAGRRTGGRTRGARPSATSDASKIREWASVQGIAAPARGRIPLAVVEQYKAAH